MRMKCWERLGAWVRTIPRDESRREEDATCFGDEKESTWRSGERGGESAICDPGSEVLLAQKYGARIINEKKKQKDG